MHGNPYKLCIFLLLLGLTLVQGVEYQDIEHAFDTLQTWYDPSKGVWMPSTGWWSSANCLTTLANLAEIDPSIKSRTEDLWNKSFTNAQLLNVEMTARHGARWSLAADIHPQKRSQTRASRRGNDPGFLNDFYDDEGWWALAWIRVYDLTKDLKYLDAVVEIFDDMHAAYDTTPVGGLWWYKEHSYVNATNNELHFSVAAHLANRCPSKRYSHTSIAEQAFYWLYGSGMITSSGNIKDGLLVEKMPGNTEIVWSYNQGVILSALTELARATSTN